MKNIIIGGTVRAGKTTLSTMINHQLGYSLVESDTIVNAFDVVFPELGIVHNKPKQAQEIYKPFLHEVLNGLYRTLKYSNAVSVFPGSQITPEGMNEYEKKDKYIIIFLGMNDSTPEELFKTIREHDTENDWTFKREDEKLLSDCREIIRLSNGYEEGCKKYGFYYFATSKNRKETLQKIVDWIKQINI